MDTETTATADDAGYTIHSSRALAIISDNPDNLSAMTSHFRSLKFRAQGFPAIEALVDRLDWPPKVDCLIINLQVESMGGASFTSALRSVGVHTPLVLIVHPSEVHLATRTFNAGILEVVAEPILLSSLTVTVQKAAARGTTYQSCRIQIQHAKSSLRRLTARQMQIVSLVTNGMTSKEIGIQLGISYRTVEAHRLRIMERLGARSLQALIRMKVIADLEVD